MAIQFVDEDGDSIYNACSTDVRVPFADEIVYLNGTDYKVERVETHLIGESDVNPVSGQVLPWALTEHSYKVYLAVVP